MTEVKRINPRRPFQMTPQGVRRIALGEMPSEAQLSAPSANKTDSKPLRSIEKASEWHIAIVFSHRGRLDDHARQAIAAAAILAKPETGVLLVILGAYTGNVADLGADAAVIYSECAQEYDPERATRLCSSLISEYEAKHVFVPDRPAADGDLGRRLIAELGATSATNVVELSHSHVSVRWSDCDLARTEPPRVILLSPGVVDAALPFVGKGELIAAPFIARADVLAKGLGLDSPPDSQVALEEADFIVAAGHGVKNVATLQALANELGAAVGASRVAVDEGRFKRSQQIGATGKTVKATTYMAVGISGAVQHLQGIRDCLHVIAINQDAGAPIVQRADLSIIGDANSVMEELHILLQNARTHSSETDVK